MKVQLMNILNNLNAIEVKGQSVMILGQVLFDLGNLINQLEQVEQEKDKEKSTVEDE